MIISQITLADTENFISLKRTKAVKYILTKIPSTPLISSL